MKLGANVEIYAQQYVQEGPREEEEYIEHRDQAVNVLERMGEIR